MNVNPYEPPRRLPASANEDSTANSLTAKRALAANRYTLTILILAVPAIANLLLFNYFITGGVASAGLFMMFATLNAIGVAFVIFGLLFWGFYIIEKLTALANRAFGRGQQLDRWHEALYDVLGHAFMLAIPAAVLWATWLWFFYVTDVSYFAYTGPITVLAHLMAASLYGRLIWRWYKIRKLT